MALAAVGRWFGCDEPKFLGDVYPDQPNRLWRLNNTAFGRYFRLNERKSNFLIEVRAGLVTFLATAYILSINANIISSSGGPCTSEDCTGDDKSFACRFEGPGGTNPGYGACVDEVRKNLITATAASTCIACFIMGGLANMPLAISAGMGLNAYFTYNVVGYYGQGSVSYNDALAAIFIEGWIFILLSITGARQFLIKLLPPTLALSMSAGIGLFLAYIGLQAAEGIGVVTAEPATLGTLGACPIQHRIRQYAIEDTSFQAICVDLTGGEPSIGAPSSNYICDGHKMTDAPFWLGVSGLAIMTVLMSRGFKGAIIVGILWVTIIAWIPGHAASYLGKTSVLDGGIGGTGDSRWAYFKKVVAAPSLSKTAVQLDFAGMGNGDVWVALVTFLYVDFCDATGTLFSMANYMNNYIPGFVDEEKNFARSTLAYCSDGVSIVIGSLMGTSPMTVFIESATGIREGGRTGLTAMTTGSCFFIALFFAPLLGSIPVFATGPALILVGALMMANAAKINWRNINHAVPAFLCIVLMPLTYSIAYGVIGGIVSYIILFVVEKVLDYGSRKTGGWFGYNDDVGEAHVDGPKAREATFHLRNKPANDTSSDDSQAGKIDAHMKDVEMQHQKEQV